MDVIVAKVTLIELAITIPFFFFFPKIALTIYGIYIISLVYISYKKTQSKFVSQINMKAALYTHSGDFKIESIPIPKFGPNEVLVLIRGAAINPVDNARLISVPFVRWYWPNTIGRDYARIVVDKGENVKKFNIGDQVYGNAKGGSLQEFTNANQDEIGHKPENISFVEAASIALAGSTSYQALKWFGKLNSSDKVLIMQNF